MASNESLLKEIRENFEYQTSQWSDIRDEGAKDMRYVAGDPWESEDRKERERAGRLILSFDEVNQYCDQLINDVRQNKRAVKVIPKGEGANDQTAEMRAGMIRQIEAKSKAQAAYLTAFQNVVHRSYGAWKYKTAYVSDSQFEQELQIGRVPNPDTIYMDWDAKEADFSDGDHAFEIEGFRASQFKKRWPDAKIQNFTTEHISAYPQWIKGEDRLQVASYWKVKRDSKLLVQFDNGKTAFLNDIPGAKLVKSKYFEQESTLAELPGGFRFRVVDQRKTEDRSVCQYITNGLEILEENEWAGKYIPIVFITGKEIYVDEGGGPKRKLLSLVRLAREPFMAYCYLWTAQVEIAQQMPKATLHGYEGQFDTTTDFANLHKVPTAYAEYKATTPESRGANPQQILPLPTRPQYAFDVQSIEAMKQSCLRAIQAACGVPPGLIGANRQQREARSGIALKTLDQQESNANFHLIDNYDTGLECGGRIMNDLLAPVYDSPRHVGIRDSKGKTAVTPINQYQKNPLTFEDAKVGFHTDQGEHEEEVSTGPSFENQREEARDFTESLTKMGDPQITRAILPEIIRLRDLGPIGEDIAKKIEALNGQQNQIPAAIQQHIQKLTAMVQQLMQEKQAKVTEFQGKAFIASQQQQVDLEKKRYDVIEGITASLVKAGQATGADQFASQMEHLNMLWERMHEFGMQQNQQQHERELSAQEHQQSLQQVAAQPQPEPQAPAQV